MNACTHRIHDDGTLACIRTDEHVGGHGCVYESSAGPDVDGGHS